LDSVRARLGCRYPMRNLSTMRKQQLTYRRKPRAEIRTQPQQASREAFPRRLQHSMVGRDEDSSYGEYKRLKKLVDAAFKVWILKQRTKAQVLGL
jgi:hypothetical protein